MNVARATLHELLYLAFIQLRFVSKHIEPEYLFSLTDFLHNVPRDQERAARGEKTYEEVPDELRERAENYEPSYASWVERVFKSVAGKTSSEGT
jgi:hypothetical protein